MFSILHVSSNYGETLLERNINDKETLVKEFVHKKWNLSGPTGVPF